MKTNAELNKQRAGWGEIALKSFSMALFKTGNIKGHDDDVTDLCADTIADILHYANLNGLDAAGIMNRAINNYFTEIKPERQ